MTNVPPKCKRVFFFTSISFLRAIIILFLFLCTFQIFFKNLGVDIKDVKPTSLLKDRKREMEGNPDFRDKDFGVAQGSQPPMIDELKSENLSHNQLELPSNAGGHSNYLSEVYSGVTFCNWTIMPF